jgi:hypothetical protein
MASTNSQTLFCKSSLFQNHLPCNHSSSYQTGHNVMGPTQVSMANVVKTVDLRDARIFVVWQLEMGLSSSCSNMLAMLISLGALLLDFAMVSECVAESQYTASGKCCRRPGPPACQQREFSEISSDEDLHHASTAWFAFLFREWWRNYDSPPVRIAMLQ